MVLSSNRSALWVSLVSAADLAQKYVRHCPDVASPHRFWRRVDVHVVLRLAGHLVLVEQLDIISWRVN
jgi:hypothetical protein